MWVYIIVDKEEAERSPMAESIASHSRYLVHLVHETTWHKWQISDPDNFTD